MTRATRGAASAVDCGVTLAVGAVVMAVTGRGAADGQRTPAAGETADSQWTPAAGSYVLRVASFNDFEVAIDVR